MAGAAIGAAIAAIISGIFSALKSSIGGAYHGEENIGGVPDIRGVSRDQYIRRVHKGERIITAEKNRKHNDVLHAIHGGKFDEWKKANLMVYPDFAAIPKINRYLEGEDGYRMVASHMPSKYSDKNVVEASERLRKEQRKGNDLMEELIDVVKEKRGRGARYY